MAKRRTKRKTKKAPVIATLRKNRKVRKPRKAPATTGKSSVVAKRVAAPIIVRKPAPPAEIARPIIFPPRPPSARRKTKKQQQLEIAEAYRAIRQSAVGQLVITDLMMFCGAYSQIDTNDPIALAKSAERRNMACHIAQMLGLRDEHFPDEAWATTDRANELMGAY